MNGSRGANGKQRSGEGSVGTGYVPAPDDVRSSLQYSALASFTPASAVMRDIPPIAIAFGDYITYNPTDPEYARIANLLDNQTASQFPDISLQQQLHAVRGLLNQVDVSYVRFKSPSATFPQPSFEYAISPQLSVPQKLPSTQQAMEMVLQNTTNNIISQHQDFNRDIYQMSGMSSQPSQSFHTTVPQQIDYNQSIYNLSTPKLSQDINSVNQREQQSTYSNKNIYESSVMYNSSDNQETRTPSSLAYIETPTHSSRNYHSNVYMNIIPQSSYQHDIRSNSPHVVTESTSSSKSYIQSNYQDAKASSATSQEIENKHLTPQVAIDQEEHCVNDLYDSQYEDSSNTLRIVKRKDARVTSPKVVIEIPPRDKLEEYRSPQKSEFDLGSSPQQLHRKSSQEYKKHRDRDRDDERNGESALINLINYMSMIFEAEDSISIDQTSNAFSPNSTSLLVPSSMGSSEPLLTTSTIQQITKLVRKVSRYKRMEDVEVEDLARLLKILDRSVREVENLDVLPKSSSKGRTRSTGSKIKINRKNEDYGIDKDDVCEDSDKMDEDSRMGQIEEKLEKVMNGIDAAIAAFAIMTGGKLSKQLYPEDLITSSLNLVKNQLGGIVYRLLESNASNEELNNEADSFLLEISDNSRIKRKISGILPVMTIYLRKLYDLMQQEELSDSIVITVSFIAIGPFFVDSASSSGNNFFGNNVESMKLVALGLLRLVFTKHQKQRTWILEEILTSLIKLPTAKRNLRQYRLPDGKSIQMVSALILQLIQSCTAGTSRYGSKEIDGRKDEILGININGDINNLKKCGNAWKTGIDAASTNAGYVFKFLLARCTKSIKNSNESEYRVLLDNFMEDVITVLNFPEWPAAEIIVHIFSKIMVGYINDKKADTYTKSMAIDYLGTIAGRIKKYSNNVLITGESTLEDNWENKEVRHWIDMAKDVPKGEITSLTSVQAVNNLWECQKVVLTFLEFCALEDSGVQCARQFYLAEWGYSFVNTLLSISENLSISGENREDNEEKAVILKMKKLLDKIIVEYWQMSIEDDVNQSLKQRSLGIERSDISLVTELLATRKALYQNFDSILSRILVSLDTGVVAFRTKALRALGQVIINDPNILSQVNVRQTIAQRLSDNSPAVRDAAIDLVGRYLSQKPEITEQYYKVISERILDTGLNVRKRVIKLLRDIYLKSTDQKMMIDIGCKILMRINDDDNHVKDLALKTIQELWFVPFKHQAVSIDMDDLDDDNEGRSEFANMSSVGKKEVLGRSLLIVGVAGRLGERNGHVLGGLFKKILEKDGKQKREVLNICQCMVDCLFEHLLTLQDSNSKTEVVSCISTICLLSNASPSLVRRHVVTLQPYLKSASSSDDQTILYYVLIIYRSVLPLLKRPNPSFLTEVEQALLGLLTKSPQKILQEVVPCLCVIVDKLTHNYARLTKLLRSCIEKLKVEKKHLDAGKDISSARNVMVLLLIIGLLCKNFDFDKKRSEKPDEMKELNLIDKGPIIAIVFQLVLYFCKESLSETVQKMALQSLGFIYLSYPIIMLRPESTNLMDRILNTGVMDMKIQLMKVFSDFLVTEQQKINTDLEDKKRKKNNPVDLKVLIGNADEFAEAGVSSSLMQRYLDRILECTFDPTQSLKIVALDVLGNIIQQGLAHPVLCMPTIVAIETSPEQTIRDKAFKLHQHLNEKHASLIHSRNVDCVKRAYAFQKQLVGDNPVVGYAVRNNEGHPEALLNPMYSLLKEKRQRRNDFLISIVKTFDFDLIRCDESTVDVGFCKFVAENLATIDYKSLEEVLHVIYCINRVLSVVAISALHSIQNNAKTLHIDMDVFNQNKAPQEQRLDNSSNVDLHDENKSPSRLSVPREFMETTNDNVELNSMLIDDVQKPDIFENIEKIETQESSREQEPKNKEKETILPLPYAAKISICMAILMYLKEHLKKAYALSEAKCQNFNPAQGGSNKDKPALRHQNAPLVITWDGLPFVEKPLLTDDDIQRQCELFRKLITEDGTQKEEFADMEIEGDSNNKQSNGYVNMDFDITTTPTFDETTHTIVKSSGGISSKKGIVRKLGSKSKNTTPTKMSGNKKRNISNSEAVSKKSKKKRKSVIDNLTDEEDSDFQL